MVDCHAFTTWTEGLSDEQFDAQIGGKWSVAEVMQHLFLSARPVARLLAGPREVLNQWGRADSQIKTYAEIARAYQQVLGTGVKAPASMSPQAEDVQIGRSKLIERFERVYDDLAGAVANWSAHELDEYCIPHPVLGKLSVREMLYFTSIHTQHHLRLLKQGLS